MPKLQRLLSVGNPDFLWSNFINSSVRQIDALLKESPDVTDDEIVESLSWETKISPLTVFDLREVRIKMVQKFLPREGYGTFPINEAWATVPYGGSAILWRMKPKGFDWDRVGIIGESTVRIRLILEHYDMSDMMADLQRDLMRASAAIRLLDDQVEEFNRTVVPTMPSRAVAWAASARAGFTSRSYVRKLFKGEG